MTRLTERLLAGAGGARPARIVTTEPGVAAGISTTLTREFGAPVGALTACAADGDTLGPGSALLEIRGTPVELANAGDLLLGDLGVACGVATNARAARAAAPNGLRIVCGGWKKLPAAMKPAVRDGLAAAGIDPRLLPDPFVYVDKFAVDLLGGVAAAVTAGRALDAGSVSVQVDGADDALVAAKAGAGAIMVDTGRLEDLAAANLALVAADLRAGVQLAFAGGVDPGELPAIAAAGGDVVDLGRAILGRPLLDLRFELL